jgi:hypothetical protein
MVDRFNKFIDATPSLHGLKREINLWAPESFNTKYFVPVEDGLELCVAWNETKTLVHEGQNHFVGTRA